ncbi:hypothetical protein RCL1_001055 [Eukaryota sp. TZLM3-RCL]
MNCPICRKSILNQNRFRHLQQCGSTNGYSPARILSFYSSVTSADLSVMPPLQLNTTPSDRRTDSQQPTTTDATTILSPKKLRVQRLSALASNSRQSLFPPPSLNDRPAPPPLVPQSNASRIHPPSSSSNVPVILDRTPAFCPQCGGSFQSQEANNIDVLFDSYRNAVNDLSRDYNQKLAQLYTDFSSQLHSIHSTRGSITTTNLNNSNNNIVTTDIRSPPRTRPQAIQPIVVSSRAEQQSDTVSTTRTRRRTDVQTSVAEVESVPKSRKKKKTVEEKSPPVKRIRKLTEAEQVFLIQTIQKDEKLQDIWVSMLLYETVSVEFLQSVLKELGFAYSKSSLSSFLDEQGVVHRFVDKEPFH